MSQVSDKVKSAAKQAQSFMTPPHSDPMKRQEARQEAAALVRSAIKPALLGGQDETALKLLELAQALEAEIHK